MVCYLGAVTILPFLGPAGVQLIHQFRPAVGTWLWEVPAGTFRCGEAPQDCARRGPLEETGYRAASLDSLGRIYPVSDFSTGNLIHMLVAHGLM